VLRLPLLMECRYYNSYAFVQSVRCSSESLSNDVTLQHVPEREMSKRIDFAKKRRDEGRSISSAVHELAALIQPIAHEHGIDLQARLSAAAVRKSEEQRLTAERLQGSVVPLFISNHAGQPERIGSCVLVHLDSDFFAFTAAHVIRDADSATLLAPSEGKGGKLLPLPPCTAHLKSSRRDNDLDVAVLVLPRWQLGAFQHHDFLAGAEIDQDDRPDDRGLESFYFVLGYSASRKQVNVSRPKLRIQQRSFRCSPKPVDAAEYLQEQMSEADHILLDFDHKEIVIGGRRVTPPRLQGVSGGGIFQIFRETKQGPLVAIATQNRRNSRLIVGTRVKHFLAMVRELKTISECRSF
jgi:hypothetical protein